jgi:hypothetical protein
MKIEIAKGEAIKEVSDFGVSIGNNILIPGVAVAAVLRDDDGKIIGFAAAQAACHAAGSYISPEFRKKGYTYDLRMALENELKSDGIPVYFAIPNTEFERELFKKYGSKKPIKEQIVQIKEL